MPELGRAALVVCLGLTLYAVLAGGYAAIWLAFAGAAVTFLPTVTYGGNQQASLR